MIVAVLGASTNPERYSNQAIRMLVEHGHSVIPVNPAYEEIEGLAAAKSLDELEPGSVDTVTMYVGADRSRSLAETLKTLRPRRVIFNPGAENPELASALTSAGIETENACTLVLLRTGAF
ncbi:MAG TPA: CoA-binding protein [Kiritimatiellia bacterium]|nr:CoA-binding protein [Kiritimatiellia bacterium]